MRVAIIHNAVARNEHSAARRDVLVQARYVSRGLARAGHVCRCFGLGKDARGLLDRLAGFRPRRIFNLVEEARGESGSLGWAAALWELLGLPYTGSPARALALTADKAHAKAVLERHGIRTPPWRWLPPLEESPRLDAKVWGDLPGPWIVKPGREDGSVGIEEDSVVREARELPDRIAAVRRRFARQPVLVERFLDGREFKVSLLGGPDGPRSLPVVEMLFVGYPPGKPRVLGYRSKWDASSFEYHHTVDRFEFPERDAKLLERLRAVSLAAWRVLGLRGYARTDLRLDRQGRVYLLECNANPCLAPDAGFVAAARQAGMEPWDIMRAILEDCVCPM